MASIHTVHVDTFNHQAHKDGLTAGVVLGVTALVAGIAALIFGAMTANPIAIIAGGISVSVGLAMLIPCAHILRRVLNKERQNKKACEEFKQQFDKNWQKSKEEFRQSGQKFDEDFQKSHEKFDEDFQKSLQKFDEDFQKGFKKTLI